MLRQLDYKFFDWKQLKINIFMMMILKMYCCIVKRWKTWNKFIVNDGFVFRANKLCILASSVHLLLLQEAHGGGLIGHFGAKKMKDIVAGHFFWPRMRRDVDRFVARCTTCQKAKS